jgi:glycine reductase complex component B subunit gamma
LDRVGIPVVIVTAMAQMAQQVGAARVVTGRKIPHPCGDPNLAPEFDLMVRKEIVDCALTALSQPVTEPTVFQPRHTL